MEKIHIPLGTENNNKVVRILQLLFGIVCLIVAISWIVLNITTFKSSTSIWATILFLIGFSYFQIISGLGKATRFVEFDESGLTLKKVAVLSPRHIDVADIRNIDVYPLSILIFLKSGRKIMFRLGATYTDIVESVRKGTEEFAEEYNIPLDYKREDV